MRRSAVDDAVAVVVQPVAVPGAHGSAVRVVGVRRRGGRAKRQNSPSASRAPASDAGDAGDPAAEPLVVDALGLVAGERAVGGRRRRRPCRGSRSCRRRTRARRGGRSRSSCRHPATAGRASSADDEERSASGVIAAAAFRISSSRCAEQPAGAVHEVGAHGDHAADHQAGDRPPRRCRSRVCQPTIAVSTVPVSTGAVPPTAKSSVNAARGDRHADQRGDRGGRRHRRRAASAAPAHEPGTRASRRRTPTRAIRVMLVPSAVMPPSAMNSACTSSTTLMHSTPVHGPTSTAASAPPSRWPLVPAPTGKFIIWPAKTNVATRPAIGAVRSSSSRRAPRSATATPADGDRPRWRSRSARRGSRRARASIDHPTLLRMYVRNNCSYSRHAADRSHSVSPTAAPLPRRPRPRLHPADDTGDAGLPRATCAAAR